jgi:hypothetical protein
MPFKPLRGFGYARVGCDALPSIPGCLGAAAHRWVALSVAREGNPRGHRRNFWHNLPLPTCNHSAHFAPYPGQNRVTMSLPYMAERRLEMVDKRGRARAIVLASTDCDG